MHKYEVIIYWSNEDQVFVAEIVLLDRDVREAFPDDESVNEALRVIAKQQNNK